MPLPVRGFVIGFAIALAVGPMSLLTIRRTIAHGRVYGLVSGLGIATADASYAAIAAFGLTALAGLLVSGATALGILGGGVIALMGVRTLLTRPGEAAVVADRPGLVGAFISIFALTMTNPTTILSFAAVFAGVGLIAGSATFADAAMLTLAVWAGSALWWVVLTTVVGWLRGRVSPNALLWVNRLSGVALIAFGIVAVVAASA